MNSVLISKNFSNNHPDKIRISTAPYLMMHTYMETKPQSNDWNPSHDSQGKAHSIIDQKWIHRTLKHRLIKTWAHLSHRNGKHRIKNPNHTHKSTSSMSSSHRYHSNRSNPIPIQKLPNRGWSHSLQIQGWCKQILWYMQIQKTQSGNGVPGGRKHTRHCRLPP